MSYNNPASEKTVWLRIFATIGIVLVLVISGMLFVPAWNVWSQSKAGEAELMRAEQSKKVLIEQARAEVEAAELRAQAIKVVGEAAKEFPEYRLQEFMGAFAEALQNDSIEKIIFVPTEAQIPVIQGVSK